MSMCYKANDFSSHPSGTSRMSTFLQALRKAACLGEVQTEGGGNPPLRIRESILP